MVGPGSPSPESPPWGAGPTKQPQLPAIDWVSSRGTAKIKVRAWVFSQPTTEEGVVPAQPLNALPKPANRRQTKGTVQQVLPPTRLLREQQKNVFQISSSSLATNPKKSKDAGEL